MNITEIKDDIDFMVGSTSATYSADDKIRNINIAYQNVARLIWESADGWQYDDSNLSTLPYAVHDMVHGQQDYELPTDAQRVERVEVKDSTGNFQKIKPIDMHDVTIALSEFNETYGFPIYYDMVGRSVTLYPAPSSGFATLTSGMQVYVSRDVEAFTTGDTDKEPGFAKPFHRVLSYAASLDYTRNEEDRKYYVEQKDQMERSLQRFYQKRNVEYKTTIKPAGKKRWRNYT